VLVLLFFSNYILKSSGLLLAQQSIDLKYLARRAKELNLLEVIHHLVKRIQEIIPDFTIPEL